MYHTNVPNTSTNVIDPKLLLHADKVSACRDLFLELGGRRLHILEAAMRFLGYEKFSRRILHRRSGKGGRAGWIAEYGWAADLTRERSERKRVRSDVLRSAIRAADKAVAEAREISGGERRPPAAAKSPPQTASDRAAPAAASPADFIDFQEWLAQVSPGMTWTWKHQFYIYEKLKSVTEGDCDRLMVFMPPRHGKSELVTIRYSAWRLLRLPQTRVILASYGQRLANRFSRGIRRVICDWTAGSPPASRREPATGTPHGYAGGTGVAGGGACAPVRGPVTSSPPPSISIKMFPFSTSRPVNCISEWETAIGGGLRAVGVGCGVTGFGADLIVIDDPVKNRAQAESEVYRERVWDWYTDDLYTRLEPGGAIILIQTRWHEDDLAGRLLRQADDGGDQWDVVDLPAIFEGPAPTGPQVPPAYPHAASGAALQRLAGGTPAVQSTAAVRSARL